VNVNRFLSYGNYVAYERVGSVKNKIFYGAMLLKNIEINPPLCVICCVKYTFDSSAQYDR